MSSIYGNTLKLSIFGQSHGPAVGMTLDSIPAGLHVDYHKLQQFLERRAPGRTMLSTDRAETDRPEFLGGIVDGYTCGAPITAIIRNHDIKQNDYSTIRSVPRPGHADFTANVKYKGFQDTSGGGHFSGRLTAPICVAGGLCKQWLEVMGIHIGAHISRIGSVLDDRFDPINPNLDGVQIEFPVLNVEKGVQMQALIMQAKQRQDSIGGIVECAVTGLRAGLGDPVFESVEGRIAQILYGIPAVKGVEFGIGFDFAKTYGSTGNDAFILENGTIRTQTNHCGGILGGITNGMPLLLQAAFKPTPSIAQPQRSVNLSSMEEVTLQIQGRHDPCILPRAVCVVEAAVAVAVFDMILGDPHIYRR